MRKYTHSALYLGEPCHSTLKAVAGNPSNSTKSFVGQVDICAPYPSPLLNSTIAGSESAELNQHSINSDICPHPPPPSLLSLQHNSKTSALLKSFNVSKGDVVEIVASMSSLR